MLSPQEPFGRPTLHTGGDSQGFSLFGSDPGAAWFGREKAFRPEKCLFWVPQNVFQD